MIKEPVGDIDTDLWRVHFTCELAALMRIVENNALDMHQSEAANKRIASLLQLLFP